MRFKVKTDLPEDLSEEQEEALICLHKARARGDYKYQDEEIKELIQRNYKEIELDILSGRKEEYELADLSASSEDEFLETYLMVN